MENPNEIAAAVDRWAGPLIVWLRGRCHSPEDIVQETFCRLIQQTKSPDRVGAWLFLVAKNLANEEARRRIRRARRESLVASREEHHPSDALEQLAMRSAIETLPMELREVVIARLWADLTFAEIATLVGTSIATTHRRYEQAIEQLRAAFQQPQLEANESHVPTQS